MPLVVLLRLATLALCAVSFGCGPLLELAAGEACGAGAVPISEVQGPGAVSPRIGEWLTVTGGVSVAASLGGRAGFFLQSLERAASESSYGLFVALDAGGRAPAAGEQLVVQGRVEEIAGVTALGAVELLEPCGRAGIEPLSLALEASADAERWEGMWIRPARDATLIDTSELSQGRLGLSFAGRSYASGHPLGARDTPESRWALEGVEELVRGWLENGTASQHLRLGAGVSGLEAVVTSAAPPTLLATSAVDLRASAAPAPEPPLAGALRVAALNLGNYFVDLGARGARSEPELGRQRQKLVAALHGLDADILALSELGATPRGAALADLLAALNADAPPEHAYSGVEGAADGTALHSALAYRAGRVRPSGAAWNVSSSAFRRAPLFQSFDVGGAALTVGVVHLKSKLCEGEQVVGPEGCGAEQRLDEARALAATLAEQPAALRERLLVIGDFNADALERPLLELQRTGLTDLLTSVPAPERYSYVFDGRASQLDHALGTPAVAAALAGAQLWHVNADEPPLLGYRFEQTPPDARRSSDHDPILLDFAF